MLHLHFNVAIETNRTNNIVADSICCVHDGFAERAQTAHGLNFPFLFCRRPTSLCRITSKKLKVCRSLGVHFLIRIPGLVVNCLEAVRGTVGNQIYIMGVFHQDCLHGLGNWALGFLFASNRIFIHFFPFFPTNQIVFQLFLSFQRRKILLLVKLIGTEISRFSEHEFT